MDTTILKALADERRMRIIELLADGERCICELATDLEASDALVSHHVKKLREAGLVRTRRVGQWLHCSLEEAVFSGLSVDFAEMAVRAANAGEAEPCSCTTDVRSPR